MTTTPRRRAAGRLALAALLALCPACADPPAPGPAAEATAPGPAGPGEIELTDPVVTFAEPNRVQFEVRYRFTKGRPSKYYLCEISFPGTPNHGAKPMESWELKADGVIRDRVTLAKPPVTTFEIRVSEADSPEAGYKLISNVATGPVK